MKNKYQMDSLTAQEFMDRDEMIGYDRTTMEMLITVDTTLVEEYSDIPSYCKLYNVVWMPF